MRGRFNVFLLIISLSFLLGVGQTVCAQESKSDEFTLDEITVTAQKRTENQQKVSIAMEVVSGQDMKELGKTDLDQILSSISTAYITRTQDGLRVQLRGVGYDTPAGYGFGADAVPSTVAVNMDGIFTARNVSGTGLYDIERVEVLFGPQSTTYASNSPGGIVNVETAKPKLEKYEASGTIEYGSFNLLHTEGAINAPVGGTLAIRAAFNTSVHDGYVSNGSNDENSMAARLKVLWKPVEKLSIIITGEYLNSTSRGMATQPGFKNQDDVKDPWYDPEPVYGTPAKTPQKKINAQVDYDLGFGVMTVIPSKMDEDYNQEIGGPYVFIPGVTYTGTVEGWGKERGVEARMTSSSDSTIKWIGAVNWYKGETFRHEADSYSEGTHTVTDYDMLMEQKAILGNITYPVSDAFRLIAGARYSKAKAMSTTDRIERFPMDTPGSMSDMRYNSPDYKLGVEYDLNKDSLLFANWSTSYRIEQEAQNWQNIAYPAQKMQAYQAGLKSRLLDKKLQFNASAYYYNYKNRMFVAMEATPFGFPDQGGRAPAKLRTYGADIQTSAILSSNDKLDLSVSYLNSLIMNLHFDYQFVPDKDYNNIVPTLSPDWTISLDYSHNFNLPNGGILTARFDSRYQSKYTITIQDSSMGINFAGYKDQEAHHIDNFGLTYTNPDGNWTLSAYLKNIWNYAEKRFMAMGGTSAGVPYMNIGTPRTFGGVLSVKF